MTLALECLRASDDASKLLGNMLSPVAKKVTTLP